MTTNPGFIEFGPADDWWQDDAATTLLREQKPAPLAALDAEINRTIEEMRRGEYPAKTFARLGIKVPS